MASLSSILFFIISQCQCESATDKFPSTPFPKKKTVATASAFCLMIPAEEGSSGSGNYFIEFSLFLPPRHRHFAAALTAKHEIHQCIFPNWQFYHIKTYCIRVFSNYTNNFFYFINFGRKSALLLPGLVFVTQHFFVPLASARGRKGKLQ